jgi:predicted small integral membrane protein
MMRVRHGMGWASMWMAATWMGVHVAVRICKASQTWRSQIGIKDPILYAK